MERINRNSVDLLSIRAGMYIVYQVGTQASPKIATVVNIRKNNRLEPTGFSTPAGFICATYVIGFAYPYRPPKPRERYAVEMVDGAIGGTVFKHSEDAESHVGRFGGRVILFREVQD